MAGNLLDLTHVWMLSCFSLPDDSRELNYDLNIDFYIHSGALWYLLTGFKSLSVFHRDKQIWIISLTTTDKAQSKQERKKMQY